MTMAKRRPMKIRPEAGIDRLDHDQRAAGQDGKRD